MTVATTGAREYELVRGWGRLPEGWEWGQAGAVAIDSHDNVHVFTRTAHPYMVFDKSGTLLDSWGEGLFDQPHGMCITPDDTMYFVDVDAHIVTKWTKDGKHRLTLGKRNEPSDTGYTKEVRVPAGPLASGGGLPIKSGVGHRGPPFHRPTDISVDTSNGDLFVSDGYRNSAVHRFDKNGTLLKSWGEPGDAQDLKNTTKDPGHFHTVHGIGVHGGKVYVGDRENYRIQIFDTDGNHLATWPGFERPTKIYIDPRTETIYVSELEDRVSVLDLDGNVLWRHGDERTHEPGKFWGPHGIWADSEGSIYVSEVLQGKRVQKFARTK